MWQMGGNQKNRSPLKRWPATGELTSFLITAIKYLTEFQYKTHGIPRAEVVTNLSARK